MSMQISPTSPLGVIVPSEFSNASLYCGVGFPIEPSFGVIPFKFATVSVVSVCPKPSISVSPVASLKRVTTSGLTASPAVVA